MFGFGCKEKQLIIESQEEMIDNLLTVNAELKSLIHKPKKRKARLSNQTGYHKVSEDDKAEMYEMYMNECDLSTIANHFKRSVSTVSRHIRSQVEERDAR